MFEEESDDCLNLVERLSWSRWSRGTRLPRVSKGLPRESLQEAQQEIKRLQGIIKEEQRRRSVPFAEAFWD